VNYRTLFSIAAVIVVTAPATSLAQTAANVAPPAGANAGGAAVETPPADYVIGTEDVLGIVFWREPTLSADVVVRPDGKISLPLLNDVHVIGQTPDQVRQLLAKMADRFVDTPQPSVVVRQINSRRVFITGNVERPGMFPLLRPTSVVQLIALAGGLREFADHGNIVIVRTDGGRQLTFRFDYDKLKSGKNLSQNIELRPGDTIIVP
jgi:polysaccharide export outer membrane protein